MHTLPQLRYGIAQPLRHYIAWNRPAIHGFASQNFQPSPQPEAAEWFTAAQKHMRV
jgi:hypothetical protein